MRAAMVGGGPASTVDLPSTEPYDPAIGRFVIVAVVLGLTGAVGCGSDGEGPGDAAGASDVVADAKWQPGDPTTAVVATAIAAAGDEPITGIARMLSPKPEVTGVHGEWDDFIRRNFPPASEPPPPFEKRKTDPSMPAIPDDGLDPYDED